LVQESTTVIDEERKWCCVCGRRKTYQAGRFGLVEIGVADDNLG